MNAEPVDSSGFLFLSFDEANLLDLLVQRIVPGDEGDPGAREAGVLTYIDRALAGPYAEWQLAYREGLRTVGAHAREAFGGKVHDMPLVSQDQIMSALAADQLPGFAPGEAVAFFSMVWAHTMEGMFCDPAYGGNRNAVGWRLIGFPGAQYGYSAEDMRYGADLTQRPVMTLGDIKRLARDKPDLFYRRPGRPPAPSRREVPRMPSPAATIESGQNQGG